MKTIVTIMLTTLLIFAMALPVAATDLTVPNSFTAGTPARAADVNANFDAVEAAVTDNDMRIAEAFDEIGLLSMENAVAYARSANNTAFLPSGGADAVVKTLTIFAPVDGYVIASFNAWFICTSGATCTPRCSIDEGGTALNTDFFTLDSVPLNGYGSLALTYAQPVATGNTTLNVVCDAFAGSGTIGDASLIVSFSATNQIVVP